MAKRVVLAFSLFVVSVAAHAANVLPQVVACGKQGAAGGIAAGVDLTRYTIDTARFPHAVCNDGTPGVFYYGTYSKPEDRNKWIIYLQGGGSCVDGQTCAERWCSVNTNYGMDKMSTSLTKAMVRANGFLSPEARNHFGSWNRVLIYYCSSDAWGGSATHTLQVTVSANDTREYEIHFHGRDIVDAVLDTLRNASALGRRRVSRHDVSEAADASPWPDLDDATEVMFAGSSGGGAGVRTNVDRVGAKLRATNPDLDYRAVIDAIYGTLGELRNFTGTTYCEKDPARGCSYETFIKATRTDVEQALYSLEDDASCFAWHQSHAPGTEWRCSDGEHVNLNHIQTPFLIRQDLQDESIGGGWVETGYGTPSDYATAVENELGHMGVPEEAFSATPGLFVPQCTNHESFRDDEATYDVKVNGISFNQAVWNWWSHAQPQQVVRHYTGIPGKAPECP